jgi:hypothetical protein
MTVVFVIHVEAAFARRSVDIMTATYDCLALAVTDGRHLMRALEAQIAPASDSSRGGTR